MLGVRLLLVCVVDAYTLLCFVWHAPDKPADLHFVPLRTIVYPCSVSSHRLRSERTNLLATSRTTCSYGQVAAAMISQSHRTW